MPANQCMFYLADMKPFFFFLLLLLSLKSIAQKPLALQVKMVDKDSIPLPALASTVKDTFEANKILFALQQKMTDSGYPAFSIDEVLLQNDSVFVRAYAGPFFKEVLIANFTELPLSIQNSFATSTIPFSQIAALRAKAVDILEEEGYVFAQAKLDSFQFMKNLVTAKLVVESGRKFMIDSIVIVGNAKVSPSLLYQYLNIKQGDTYKPSMLKQFDKTLANIEFAEVEAPVSVKYNYSGVVIEVALKQTQNNQVDVLMGLQPKPKGGGYAFTYNALLSLNNLFGNAEKLQLQAQQFMPSSPSVLLGYERPYLFKKPIGAGIVFSLNKEDSNLLQVKTVVSFSYLNNPRKVIKAVMSVETNSPLNSAADTVFAKQYRLLPDNADLKLFSAGISYEINTTDHIFNPRSGYLLQVYAGSAMRSIKPNNYILALKDPSFSFDKIYDSIRPRSISLRSTIHLEHYISLAGFSVFKTAIQGGYYKNATVFKNELFRLGGYKTLRGFDERRFFTDLFAIGTAEYRLLLSKNSYLAAFADGGLVHTKFLKTNMTTPVLGAGLGMLFQTKAGLINLSFAAGWQKNETFNLRRASRIHFGYINYF